jgi:CO/xanthine dehydrogenase FAD-binding subunit
LKPAAFAYHAPRSVEEAVALLAELGDGAKVLAGGQSLVPLLSLRLAHFDHLVDVGRISDLNGVRREADAVVIGAATVDAAVEADSEIVVSVTAFLRANPQPTTREIREALSGNLCRCTGYQGIINAVRLAAAASGGQATGATT